MKKNNYSENTLNKKSNGVIISALVMCFCVILLTFIFAGCAKPDNENADVTTTTTSDTQKVTESTTEFEYSEIDVDTYTFAEGISIGNASLANKTYREAKEIATEELDKLIKDFDITVVIGKEKYNYNREKFVFDDNIEEVLEEAVYYNNNIANSTAGDAKNFDLAFEVNSDSVAAEVAILAKLTDTEPVDASITGAKKGKVTISKAKDGKQLNQEKLIADLTAAVNALSQGEKGESTIKAEIKAIKPKMSQNELTKNITLLSSYTTVSTNTADGNHNMKLALDSCNGSVIEPGAVWSFNECTGNSNLESLGYRAATVIIGGELVPGIGGGLCQSSTTIYNAAIRTNMEIVERYCHYFQSTYAPAGLDATIDYPNLDLKLKNPTKYPMYMQCYMSGTTLYCNIYGYQDPSFDKVEIDSYVYDANPDENYYRAGATRTFYKNGKVVLEEQLHGSTYHYKSPSKNTTETTTAKPTKKPAPKPTAKPTPKPTTPAVTTPKATTPVATTPKPTTPATTVQPPVTPTTPIASTPIELPIVPAS